MTVGIGDLAGMTGKERLSGITDKRKTEQRLEEAGKT